MNQKTEIESEDVIESEESVSSNQEKLESKKKMKKVRSMKLQRLSSRGRKPHYDHKVRTTEVVEASPNYMKATGSSNAKDGFQITQKRKMKSSRSIKLLTVKGPKSTTKLYSESIDGSDSNNRKSTSDAGNKSQRVMTRRLSLKPVRISSKKPSLHKATCSSTIKDSHFPNHIDLPQEGSSSQGVSAVKVCTYAYCSLHGHQHGDLPLLKRFVSMRRRQLKSQKSTKKDGRSKQVGNARNATQKTKSVQSEDGNSQQNVQNVSMESSPFKPHDAPPSTVNECDTSTKDKHMVTDYEVLQKSSTQEEPKASSTTSVAFEVQERDQKYIKKWHLMYKHAVLSNTGKCDNKLPFVGKDKEGREQGDTAFNGGNNSCHNYNEADSDMDDEKKNMIELVQKAFDEILLPETEDLSSNNRSKSRSYGSDEVLLEKSEGEREEMNATSFTETPKEAQKTENKPKSWSHLKKLIMLKRFVKALDKVRNINPRRPRELTSDANFEGEKVFLNRQTSEERKKSEEWMLDYALQKVISKLAPAQRQRVTLLIEAFETLRPIQDAENGSRSSATVESQENPSQSLDASSVLSAKTLLGKLSFSNDSTMEFSDKASDNPMPEHCKPIKPVEAPTKRMVDEVPEDLVSDLNTKTKDVISGHGEQFSVTKSLILNGLVRSLRSNLVVPEAPSNLLDEPTTDIKDVVEKDQLEKSEAPTSAVVEPENQLEKQGSTGLWFTVFKHMVSDMTENNSKTSTDVADEKDSKYEDSTTRETSVSYENTHVVIQDMPFKDHAVADAEIELRQIEAIKMVEDAIDSILPDTQPLPDNSTIDKTGGIYSEGLNQKEEKMESGNGIAEERKEESVSKEVNKPNQKLSRNWSNLKKVVLLRRFIKALEKVRKFNPRGPRYLPLEPDSEDEKVRLRHQDTAERKGTEEWMLDYALRQVVSKLTPARKRKVELLVEAFETVVPTVKH